MGEEQDSPTEDLFTGVEDVRGDLSDGEPIFTPEDRPRGILSPTDRAYLCGLKEYAQPQTDANRRQAIRERITNGLKDFQLLTLMLDREEREKIFEEFGPEEIDDVLAALVAFAYLCLDRDRSRFETCIEHGVILGANVDKLFQSSGRATAVDVSISVEYNPDLEKLERRLDEGKALTDAEIGALARARKLDAADLEELAADIGVSPGMVGGMGSESSE